MTTPNSTRVEAVEAAIPLLVAILVVLVVVAVVNSLELVEKLLIVLLLKSIGFTRKKFQETKSLIIKEKAIKLDLVVKES